MNPRNKNDKLYVTMARVYSYISSNPNETNFNKMIFFMFRTIESFVDRSPKISRKYFSIAKDYWIERKLDKNDLSNYNYEIYQYLDSIDGILEWEDPNVCSVKSVKYLFSTYNKDNSEEIADTFETFVELIVKWVNEEDLLSYLNTFKDNLDWKIFKNKK